MFNHLFRITLVMIAMAIGFTCAAAELVIGQVAPFSTVTAPGAQMRAGIQLYFDAVNARGGVNKAKLRLVSKERGLKAEDSVIKTRELLAESEPLALIGLQGTGAMEALVKSKILEEAGIPVVGIRTGSISLHEPVNPLLFHMRANYAAEVETMITQMGTVGLTRIAVFYENTTFGKEGLALIDREIKRKKYLLVGTGTYELNSTVVAGAVKTLLGTRPNAVILVANSPAAAEFYKAWRATGNMVRIVALSVTDGTEVAKQIGNEAARGLMVTQVMPDPTNKTMPLVREFHENAKKFPQKGMVINQTSLEGYLAAKVLVEALKRAGPNPTRSKVRHVLESMSEYDTGGVIIRFSPTNHTGAKFVESAILLRNGKFMR